MTKKEKKETGTSALTVGDLIDELKRLPRQAEVIFTDVCGNSEAEIYQVDIDADNGRVLIVGDEFTGEDKDENEYV